MKTTNKIFKIKSLTYKKKDNTKLINYTSCSGISV